MKRISCSAILLGAWVLGCDGTRVDEEEFRPATLELVPLNGLPSGTPAQEAVVPGMHATSAWTPRMDEVLGYDFGDINATEKHYFLLVNSGTEPAEGVSLTLPEGSPFVVAPQSIGVVEPFDDGASFLPIIEIAVEHGVPLAGVGTADVREMGEIESELTLSGNGGEVTTTLGLMGVIRVMQAQFKTGDGATNFMTTECTSQGFSSATVECGSGELLCCNAGTAPPFKVLNIGNVDFVMDLRLPTVDGLGKESFAVPAGGELDLPGEITSVGQIAAIGFQNTTNTVSPMVNICITANYFEYHFR